MLICEALRRGRHHQLGRLGHVTRPNVYLSIYFHSTHGVASSAQTYKSFHPVYLYNKYDYSCTYGSSVLL